jgi:hypothetical protein
VDGDVEIRIDAMSGPNMNNHTHRNCQFRIQILRTSEAEGIVPQVEMGANPYVCLAQSYEGRYM